MCGNGERTTRDARGRVSLSGTPACTLALAAFVAAGASVATSAARASPVELWLSDAPLGRVLEHVAGTDGVQVRIDPSIEGVIDGRLEGEREVVLARLVVEHELTVHGNGDTIWFDRADRPVVEFVELAPDDADAALSLLDGAEGEATPDAVVERSDEGVMLSGSRAFVENSLDRLAALPQALPGTASSASLVTTVETATSTSPVEAVEGVEAAASTLPAETAEPAEPTRTTTTLSASPDAPDETGTPSVSDIPGYDVDYTQERSL